LQLYLEIISSGLLERSSMTIQAIPGGDMNMKTL
jgi:hypothetical protein